MRTVKAILIDPFKCEIAEIERDGARTPSAEVRK
jgi:hypothetical protein